MTNRRKFVKQLALAGTTAGMPRNLMPSWEGNQKAKQSGNSAFWLELVSPESIGMDSEILAQVDVLVKEEIAIGHTPGAVVALGRGNKMGFLKGYGNRQLFPDKERISLDTIFDLASVTKVASTATALAIVIENGLVSPDDLVIKYFPSFGVKGKDKITVRHLATHTSGLGFYNHFIKGTREELFNLLCSLSLNSQVGEKYEYNDNNALMIGHIVEKVSGQSLDRFTRENIYLRLGMMDTMYNPNHGRIERTAATEMRDGIWYKGKVNDFATFNLGGVGGDTGLFSTAPDLAILSALWLGKGTYIHPSGEKIELFREGTFEKITDNHKTSIGLRGLLWDKRSGSANRPWNMSPNAFGHGGWTGTSIWIDPDLDLFVVMLGNRRHPFGQTPNIYSLASNIGVVGVNSILYKYQSLPLYYSQDIRFSNRPRITPSKIHLLKGKKIGLILTQEELGNNNSALSSIMSQGMEVSAIFIPETLPSSGENKSSAAIYKEIPVYTIRHDSPGILPNEIKNVEMFVYGIKVHPEMFEAEICQYIRVLGYVMQSATDYHIKFAIINSENSLKNKFIDVKSLTQMLSPFHNYYREFRQFGLNIEDISLKINEEQNLKLEIDIIEL